MDRLADVVTILSGALILVVLVQMRRAHIRVEYSVSWLAAGVTLLVVSRFEVLINWLSGLVGIADPPVVLLFVSFSVFLLVFYRFSVIISHMKDSNIALAQRVAILQYQMDSLNEERQTSKEG